MSSEDHWITARVSEARARHTSVTEAVSSRIAEELKGKFGDQPVSQKDITTLANQLIADMSSASSERNASR